MGYKQELKRQYSTVQVFAIAFSIMGLVPSIASTLAFSLPAGPVGMVWVWICLPRGRVDADSDRGGLLRVFSFSLLGWRWYDHSRFLGICTDLTVRSCLGDAHGWWSVLVDALLRWREI